jgi:hypothetical protein
MEGERRFFEELEKKLNISKMEMVRREVNTYDQDHGVPEDLSEA